jgi:hypothetical protein
MVVSAADTAFYVYRNGNPIGRALIEINGRGSLGDNVFSMLEGTTSRLSFLAPGKQARRWMRITSGGRPIVAEEISSRLRMNPEFADKVYNTFAPGTMIVITDQSVVGPAQPRDPGELNAARRLLTYDLSPIESRGSSLSTMCARTSRDRLFR